MSPKLKGYRVVFEATLYVYNVCNIYIVHVHVHVGMAEPWQFVNGVLLLKVFV